MLISCPLAREALEATHDVRLCHRRCGHRGVSVAYELARDASVCLLEAESRPGFHATGRSAALFTPTYGGREVRAVTRASRMFFDQPPANFCEHPLLTPRGCLYIARPIRSRGSRRWWGGFDPRGAR